MGVDCTRAHSRPERLGAATFWVGFAKSAGLAGTKSEVPEELSKALEAAAQAQAVLREVGDRVGRGADGLRPLFAVRATCSRLTAGEGKAMHTTAVSCQHSLTPGCLMQFVPNTFYRLSVTHALGICIGEVGESLIQPVLHPQVALSFQNNIDEAVARSRELVSYWQDLGYARLEARKHASSNGACERSWDFGFLGSPVQAFQQECVSEWELVRHRPEEARDCSLHMTNPSREVAEALEAAQAALEQKMQREAQVEPSGPARSAAALIHASNAYLTMGKTEEALKLSQERLETFRRNADFESEIVAQSSIVSVYVNSGRMRQAADVAEETLRRVRSRPSSRLLKCWEIDLLQTLAKIYLRAEDLENSEKIVDQTIAVANEQKDAAILCFSFLKIRCQSQGPRSHPRVT